MLIAGVDDAGRGAVIGPLVIAGVLVKNEDLVKVENVGGQGFEASFSSQTRVFG